MIAWTDDEIDAVCSVTPGWADLLPEASATERDRIARVMREHGADADPEDRDTILRMILATLAIESANTDPTDDKDEEFGGAELPR